MMKHDVSHPHSSSSHLSILGSKKGMRASVRRLASNRSHFERRLPMYVYVDCRRIRIRSRHMHTLVTDVDVCVTNVRVEKVDASTRTSVVNVCVTDIHVEI